MLRILRVVDGVAQRDHRRGCGIVGDENGGKVLVARARPMEWARDSGATADLLDGKAVDITVELVVAEAGGGRGQRGLVAESGRAGGWWMEPDSLLNVL